MAAYQVLLLNTAIPQIQAAQSGDTYVVPRDIAFSTVASIAAGTEALPSLVATGDVNTGFWFPAADTIAASTGGTRRLTLDSSGNLGLGVTPSAWGTGYKAIQFPSGTYGGGSFVIDNGSPAIAANAYNNSGWKYVNNDFATIYQSRSGEHQWYTAASGTAGNAISFTQAMTLDASGNLGVGQTSPSYKLDVSGSARITSRLYVDTGTAALPSYSFVGWTDTGIWNPTGTSIGFSTSGTERARITSGGYFKASNDGAYLGSTGGYHELRTNNATYVAYITNTNATPSGAVIEYSSAAPNGTGNLFLYCGDNTAERASIRSNGGIANYQANDVNLSDARLKTDIAPVASYWDKIKSLEVVSFKYKDQTDDIANIGVIAQQVESVAPEFVSNEGFGTAPEGEAPYKTIYTTDMYHAAIKALQEAMARIETLEAKIAALEAK